MLHSIDATATRHGLTTGTGTGTGTLYLVPLLFSDRHDGRHCFDPLT